MREIKFRAPDGVTGQFVYFNLCDLGTSNDSFGISLDLDKAEQFTGVRDKNGREIYEGDILGGSCGLAVHWCDVCHGLELTYPGHGCFACAGEVMLRDYAQDELEVIGNIHENPELLE